jgi:hypothetical protein
MFNVEKSDEVCRIDDIEVEMIDVIVSGLLLIFDV